jgi:hypothetical protein
MGRRRDRQLTAARHTAQDRLAALRLRQLAIAARIEAAERPAADAAEAEPEAEPSTT